MKDENSEQPGASSLHNHLNYSGADMCANTGKGAKEQKTYREFIPWRLVDSGYLKNFNCNNRRNSEKQEGHVYCLNNLLSAVSRILIRENI